jgi:flagellar basal body-associated protein FliL
MLRKIFPLVLCLIGAGAGAGAGLFLRPVSEPDPTAEEVAAPVDPALVPDYVKLSNQFVVPLVERERISAMVILTLSLEVTQGTTEQVYAREPKLRDAFLQLLFDHANTGGFRGSFTDAANLVILRKGLLDIAKGILGDIVTDVLITDIVRQDN